MEKLIDKFFYHVNNRELDQFEDLLGDDAVLYFPKTQPLAGRNQIERFFKILYRRFPRLEFHVQRKIIQRPWAAIHWTNQGVNKTGEHYENEGVTLLETEKGKIRVISDFFKDTGKF